MDREEPIYGIRAAAERIGIAPGTLRAWESRYGVPQPARTESRYRLYSERDVALVRWMRARMAEGVPAGRAAELARTIGEREIDRTPEVTSATATGGEIGARILPVDAPRGPYHERLLSALMSFDEERVSFLLREATAALRPTDVMRDVLLPAVARIGGGWESGSVSVAQEHFASHLARAYAERLLGAYEDRGRLPPTVCACAPGERHELGLLAVAVDLRHRGAPVVYLGQEVPAEDVLDTAAATAAAGIVVATVLPGGLTPWSRCAGRLRRAISATGLRVLWAGPAAADAPALGLPGETAATIDEAVEAAMAFTDGSTPSSSG